MLVSNHLDNIAMCQAAPFPLLWLGHTWGLSHFVLQFFLLSLGVWLSSMVCLGVRIRLKMKNILKKKERETQRYEDEYNRNGIRFKIETAEVCSREEKFEDLSTLLENLAWGELDNDFQYCKFNNDHEEQIEDGMESAALEISNNPIKDYDYWKIDGETLLVESSTESIEIFEEPAELNDSDDDSSVLTIADIDQAVTFSYSWHFHSTIAQETHL